MPIAFSADEAFGLAEQIERNGAAFYRKAAANSAQGRELLLKLAVMEDGHLKTFQDMHATVSGREAEATVWDPDNEGALYLQNMAGGYVFDTKTDPSAKLSGKETLAEVLKIAIGLEKDSIVFYLGIRDAVPRKAGRDKVDAIIAEEMKHVTMLSDELKKV
jgi:rubrerythrin